MQRSILVVAILPVNKLKFESCRLCRFFLLTDGTFGIMSKLDQVRPVSHLMRIERALRYRWVRLVVQEVTACGDLVRPCGLGETVVSCCSRPLQITNLAIKNGT